MKTLADHLIAKNDMNPKLERLAVDLGHLNVEALKELINFVRSGESIFNVAPEAPAAEVETPAEDTTEPASEPTEPVADAPAA